MRLLFIGFVLFISSIIMFYRNEYVEGDLYLHRFINLVLLFVLLIISPNLIRLLLGLDGLGLVSYLLVIYFQYRKSYNAGIIAALRNRLGDVALLFRIAWIVNFRYWNSIYYLDNFWDWNINVIIRVLIIFAAITKSAQIPFSAWLPEAMAAPTPVFSLVHSSTLVTAGVYLLIRFYGRLDLVILKILLLLGVRVTCAETLCVCDTCVERFGLVEMYGNLLCGCLLGWDGFISNCGKVAWYEYRK